MDKKTKDTKAVTQKPLKTLKLKRETIKELNAREKKQIKGGGGGKGSVVQSRIV